MALRYTAETLVFLRESPLCVKPSSLPPTEEWMGPPADTRNKTFTERGKGGDNTLLDQTNRSRPGADRHTPRNGQLDPEDIILGPPRTSFASASSTIRNGKPGENDRTEKSSRDSDNRDRFNFRNRPGEDDGADRFRDGRNGSFRRRPEGGEQDSDGWSTVKPRKSFGQEGAERFQGRMGGGGRYKDEQPRDREDRDNARDTKPRRNFDGHTRDATEEGDYSRRNGLNRGRTEPWFSKDAAPNEPASRPSQRERIDKAKSWRDRDNHDRAGDNRGDRGGERTYERRWDRDQHHRNEREPEWLDEPAEEKTHGHTEEDFKKFMESMKASRGGAPKPEGRPALSPGGMFDVEEPKVKTAPAVESGPDKFFAAFAGASVLDMATKPSEVTPEAARPNFGKTSSRFTSFFSSQGGDSRTQTEPPIPAALPTPTANHAPPPPPPGQQTDADKEAFQALLQKLQRQTLAASATPPGASAFSAPPPPNIPELQHKSAVASPDLYMRYGNERPEPRHRPSQPSVQEILAPRPMQLPSQPPSSRPEQMLQDLVGQRIHAPSQGSGRAEQNGSTASSNAEFLMRLMRAAPEPPRPEQLPPPRQQQPPPPLLMRMPQPQKQAALAQMQERELEFHRDRSASQRHMRPQGPVALFEEQFNSPESEGRPPQPTQILQRPPPPGLEHQMQPPWMAAVGHGPIPPPQRPMIPPPGLVGNPGRNVPIPAMFPPNFPPGVFPPPEAMNGPPPRNMQPPPGFFGGPPPPAFIPPPGMVGFQGPEGLPFGVPFDGRGIPPPGAGAAFRRP